MNWLQGALNFILVLIMLTIFAFGVVSNITKKNK